MENYKFIPLSKREQKEVWHICNTSFITLNQVHFSCFLIFSVKTFCVSHLHDAKWKMMKNVNENENNKNQLAGVLKKEDRQWDENKEKVLDKQQESCDLGYPFI